MSFLDITDITAAVVNAGFIRRTLLVIGMGRSLWSEAFATRACCSPSLRDIDGHADFNILMALALTEIAMTSTVF